MRVLELIIDYSLFLHIGVSFFSAFYRDVYIVADFPYIAVAYLRSYFWIDCLSTVPGIVVAERGSMAESLYYFKFLRLLKAGHFMSMLLKALRALLLECTQLTTRTISVIVKLLRY